MRFSRGHPFSTKLPMLALLVLLSITGSQTTKEREFQDLPNMKRSLIMSRSTCMYSEVQSFYSEMKMTKNHKYGAFKLSDNLERIVMDETMLGEKAQTSTVEEEKVLFDQMKEKLQKCEPRFIVFDFRAKLDTIAFIAWYPYRCPFKKTQAYVTKKEDVRDCLRGTSIFQIRNLADMDYDKIVAKLRKRF